jgi:nitroreductase
MMAALHKGGQTTDQKGVIQFIATKPFGEFALALVAAGLVCCPRNSWNKMSEQVKLAYGDRTAQT